ncbi:azurin [Jiulongibacter sediminis]|uniref:azurin n=1 Tax=Jiulongibacter sediminis TaxID=1605367 RepID=UPI000ACCF56B|nr:azurin [Jiulongibacter sediminis]
MKKLMITLAAVAVLSSCSSSSEENTETLESTENAVAEVAEPAAPAKQEVTVELESNDMMKFNKTEIFVPAGSTVTLNLTHTGKMEKAVMGHNFVLLAKGTDIPAFVSTAIAAKENDYIPESDAIIAHTGLIGGGESTSVTFEAPAPGTYQFICSFPGHYGAMKGEFIVE